MIARDRRAAARKKNLCAATIRGDCEGITHGVTSWIVHTMGGFVRGKTLALGENTNSAEMFCAAMLAPPSRHKRSRLAKALFTTEKPGPASQSSGSLPKSPELNRQNSTWLRRAAALLNCRTRFRPYTCVP